MCNISLSMSRGAKTTVISNRFIDRFMPEANGSYVKVYIYLLRLMSDSSELSLSIIAERLDETEKDIRRALKYWEEKGILTVRYNSFGEITDIVFMNPDVGEIREKPADIVQIFEEAPASSASEESYDYYTEEELTEILPAPEPGSANPVMEKPSYSPKQIALIMSDPDMKSLTQKVEKVTKKPISHSDAQIIMFLFECLRFSPDLISYLYEYCSERGTIASSYVEKVALGWAQNGIRTVAEAKEKNDEYDLQLLTVSKAFGFRRSLADAEKVYIRRWFNDFGFSTDMVKAACDRTIVGAKEPSFKYADKILCTWYQLGIRTLDDLKAHDAEYNNSRAKRPAPKKPAAPVQPNKFGAFQQRSYSSEELADLEKKLMNK